MPDYTTLISVEQLKALLHKQQGLVILDTRFDLGDTDAGWGQYVQGHLPGAQYAHLETALSGPKTGLNGRHPLPELEVFALTVAEWGIAPKTQVIVYDAQAGLFAARAWWMLCAWLGHKRVAVLDGGLKAWQEAGESLSQQQQDAPLVSQRQATYSVATDEARQYANMIDGAQLHNGLKTVCVLDARAPERFSGQVEPLDAVAGHIPGALNRFFKDNLDATGRFKPAETLRAEFNALIGAYPVTQVVHQCGSGVTACHNLLAMEIAGLSGSRLYPGSWSEWCVNPARPVVVNPPGVTPTG